MKDVDTIKYDNAVEIVEAVDRVMKTIEDDYPVVNIYAKYDTVKEIFQNIYLFWL